MSDVTVEVLRQADYPQIKAFLEEAEHPGYIHVTPVFFDWFYNKNPMRKLDSDEIPMLGLRSQGSIVGMLTYHPVVFRLDEAHHEGCWMVDWFVEEQYRGMGVALLLWLKRRYQVIAAMGFNTEVAPLYRQAGFQIRDEMHRPVIFVDAEACFELAGQRTEDSKRLLRSLKVDGPANLDGVQARPVEHYYSAHEALWEEARPFYPIGTHRSVEYLRWRYEENPFIDYKGVELWTGGTLRGLLVARIEQVRDRQEKVGRIVEWICPPQWDRAMADVLLGTLMHEGCAFADFFTPSKGFEERLLEAGFHTEQEYNSLGLPRLFQPLEHRGRQGINCALWIDAKSDLTAYGDLDRWYITKSDINQDDPTALSYPRRGYEVAV